MKKILAITSIRSDYDLMSYLYKLLNEDKQIKLKLLVAGAHLSTTYGRSIDLIKQDKIKILLEIESLIDSNSRQSRLKSASILLQNSIDAVAQFNPDLILYPGDREDALVGALLGGYLGIPTIHFFGGDHVQDGHIDNPIRHAISKLSTVHLVSIDQHKERLLKMGEKEDRIFVIGSISLDKIFHHKPISRQELKGSLKISKGFEEFALLIFHPVDTELNYSHLYFENILLVLKKLHINTFVSYPNTDPGNKDIIRILEKYKNDSNFFFYKNLDRNLFLSIYKNSLFQIGNSSSGIIESASIPLPVVNVGIRQRGRIANENVIFCDTNFKSISGGIKKAISPEFKNKINKIKNLYGDGKSSKRAYKIIKEQDFDYLLLKTEDILEL